MASDENRSVKAVVRSGPNDLRVGSLGEAVVRSALELLSMIPEIEQSLERMRALTLTFKPGQPVRTSYRGGSWTPHALRAVVVSVEAPPSSRFVRIRVTRGRHGVPVGRELNVSPFALVKLPSKRRPAT